MTIALMPLTYSIAYGECRCCCCVSMTSFQRLWYLCLPSLLMLGTILLLHSSMSNVLAGFIGGIVTYLLLNGIGWGFDWMTKKGVPFIGPSEILLDEEASFRSVIVADITSVDVGSPVRLAALFKGKPFS